MGWGGSWGREVLDQVSGPNAVRASGTPKRFWLWSKYGPSGPLPAPGHSNPRLSHIPLLFSWLQNASGYQSRWGVSFFLLIFTHKMCISTTKASMMGPYLSANFLPVLSGISCATSICNPFVLAMFKTPKWPCITFLFLTKGISKGLCCIKHLPPSITENYCPLLSKWHVFFL